MRYSSTANTWGSFSIVVDTPSSSSTKITGIAQSGQSLDSGSKIILADSRAQQTKCRSGSRIFFPRKVEQESAPPSQAAEAAAARGALSRRSYFFFLFSATTSIEMVATTSS